MFTISFWLNCSKSSRNLQNNVNGYSLIDVHLPQVWPSGTKSDGSRVTAVTINTRPIALSSPKVKLQFGGRQSNESTRLKKKFAYRT